MSKGNNLDNLYNETAEKTVLGSMLIAEELAQDTDLTEADFYEPTHKKIFNAIQSVKAEGKAVDFVTVTEYTDSHKTGVNAGYIAEIMSNIPSTANFDYYKGILKDKTKVRNQKAVALAILEQINSGADPDKITEQAKAGIKSIEDESYKYIDKAENHRASSIIDSFIDSPEQFKITPTGFENLDTVLGGGLQDGFYVIGAMSSLGKTTFCLQIADQIARGGTDILYFALEMSSKQMIAKSVSRHTFQIDSAKNRRVTDALTERDLLTANKGRGFTVKQKELRAEAIEKYRQYADRIYYYEGIGDIGMAEIRKQAEKHISQTGKTPIIIVDYLQILAPADIRATDKQNTDKAVLELKRLSRDLVTPVIAISSFNRDSYKVKANFTALKESGAIEYTADVVIGLELTGVGDKDFDIEEAKAKTPREITLRVLKNRSYRTGNIELEYYSAYNCFEECGALEF